MIATGTPLIVRVVDALNTGSPKSVVFTFCARNSIPPSSFSTASFMRFSP